MPEADPSGEILFDVHGQIATITFNRPEAMNAVRPRTYQELTDAFLAAAGAAAAGLSWTGRPRHRR